MYVGSALAPTSTATEEEPISEAGCSTAPTTGTAVVIEQSKGQRHEAEWQQQEGAGYVQDAPGGVEQQHPGRGGPSHQRQLMAASCRCRHVGDGVRRAGGHRQGRRRRLSRRPTIGGAVPPR